MEDRDVIYAYQLLELEARRCMRWLAADENLGVAAICGPLSWRVYKDVRRERAGGYLGTRNEITPAGWWKLAYLAGQGVGPMDRRRQKYLGRLTAAVKPGQPKTVWQQRRPHLRAVQRMVFGRMAREDVVPLGIEFSSMHNYIYQQHRLRPDALLFGLNPQRLIYVEYLRKLGERQLSKSGQSRFDRMRETLKVLSGALEVDVVLDYKSKGDAYEMLYEPGRLGQRKRELQVVEPPAPRSRWEDEEEDLDLELSDDTDWDSI
jgi:hypothetical protein